MKNLNFIKPYSNDQLSWNSTTEKYELTLQCVKSEFKINFSNDEETTRRIKKNTRKIYNYIKYHSSTVNSGYIDILLNKTEEGRRFLLDVLLEQFEADNETGYNDLSSQPAINIANGQVINREELERNQISVDTEQIIERNADYFGFNICMMMPYPLGVQLYLNGK